MQNTLYLLKPSDGCPEMQRYMASVQSKLNYAVRASQLRMLEDEAEKGKK